MGIWDDDTLNCDFKAIHCKLEQFERDLQSASQYGGYQDSENTIDGLLDQERGMEDRIQVLQRELDALDDDGGGSSEGRRQRPQSPGELRKKSRKKYIFSGMGRSPRGAVRCGARVSSKRSYSGGRGTGCNCRCNTSSVSFTMRTDPDKDDQIQDLRAQLRDVNAGKHDLQERIFALEEELRQAENDLQMLRSQLEALRIKCRQLEEENDELLEEIRRLEQALNTLPVSGGEGMRDAADQIACLLQSLNDDMVKAPELCNRLRMAAQQILDGERRLSNERSSRAMDQVEVQYLRNENQRLRELSFQANMTAFQASVQLPQDQMAGYNQAVGPALGPGGACYNDPYGQYGSMSYGQSSFSAGGSPGGPGGAPPGQRKSIFQRMFHKKDMQPDQTQSQYQMQGQYPMQGQSPMQSQYPMQSQSQYPLQSQSQYPMQSQYRLQSQAQVDPQMVMTQHRLTMAENETPEEAAKRLAMINQDEQKKKGCFGKS